LTQIETIEKQMISEKSDQQSIVHTSNQLDNLNQLIKDRERQLKDVLRIRNSLKEEIENYRKRLERYPKQNYYNKRSSMHEMNYSSTEKSTSRLSLQEPFDNTNEQTRPSPNLIQSAYRSSVQIEELWVIKISSSILQNSFD